MERGKFMPSGRVDTSHQSQGRWCWVWEVTASLCPVDTSPAEPCFLRPFNAGHPVGSSRGRWRGMGSRDPAHWRGDIQRNELCLESSFLRRREGGGWGRHCVKRGLLYARIIELSAADSNPTTSTCCGASTLLLGHPRLWAKVLCPQDPDKRVYFTDASECKQELCKMRQPSNPLAYRFPGRGGAGLLGEQVWRPQGRQRECSIWALEAKTAPTSLVLTPKLTGWVNLEGPLRSAAVQASSFEHRTRGSSLPACQAGGRSSGQRRCESASVNPPALKEHKKLLLLRHSSCSVLSTRPHARGPWAGPALPQAPGLQPCVAFLSRSVLGSAPQPLAPTVVTVTVAELP